MSEITYKPFLAGIPIALAFVLIAIFIYTVYQNTCVSCTKQDLTNIWNLLGFIPLGGYWLGCYICYMIFERNIDKKWKRKYVDFKG